MSAVLLSPNIHSHPSFVKASSRAVGTWLTSICWLSRHGRSEHIPAAFLPAIGATPSTSRRLIDVGLWEPDDDGVWVPQFVAHSWSGRHVQVWKFGPAENARAKIPAALRAAVYARDGFSCLHCGVSDDLTLDHIHPWSLGGADTLANLQTLCRPCNSRKGARV